MIKSKRNKCKKELNEFDAIVLSLPDNKGKVKKYHLCLDCWFYLEQEINESRGILW